MSLKTRLAQLGTARAVEIDAPELGEGQTAHVRRLTVGERIGFFRLFEHAREKLPTGEYRTPPVEQVKTLLPLVACEPDGTPSFAEVGDAAVDQVPAALAERMIVAAMEYATAPTAPATRPESAPAVQPGKFPGGAAPTPSPPSSRPTPN